ncbi:3-keto-disaccharide hydrolase [Pyrinomonas methylaliphatogenes]|jgi:hypothetical protein|uniref:3-keto-alpha-glucoside-1,2-lyase/3-keto-2-hydroxy-glucal hydratase domain-containing protein n=1 Tax=Pyrinomonas methylaliphatogenes TaxID=454194 RepID=A0A0B6WTS6_9BACT|nr:DUF1080 domain-containing protein [Pyrinomonas methylaliphatogenes]MBX5479275.1 DUF1080 domain-containing protein [Pyrinomonas methylaliphatogenes]CDM64613.1 protein of unknown function (DUF1080) [Pyrinomonas methylaliphatogenes]
MSAIFRLLISIALLSPFGYAQAARSDSTWRQLFNGRDLAGWEHVGSGKFVVEGGLLRTEGGMGLLWYTREKFGNCVIRVVYKTNDPAANSGVFVRIADRPKDEWFAVHHGYEVQILDRQDAYHRTGAIYSLAPSRSVPSKPVGEWNTLEITLAGERIIVRLNGVEVTRFDPKQPVPPRAREWEPERGNIRPIVGYIGLQNHDDYARGKPTHVYFKEVSVRPLRSGD